MHHYHSRDLRSGRFSEPDRPYLVTTATFHRRSVFSDLTAGYLLAREIRNAECQEIVSSLCWVIMPDHFHWLVILHRTSLARLMRRVKSRSAISINRMKRCSGRLWQPGFHDRALRFEENLRYVSRYVIANPLRAGLVDNIDDYPLWDAAWVDRKERNMTSVVD